MNDKDWESFYIRLLDGTRAAVDAFAAEHAGEEVCYMAFDSEPRYGYVLIAFNTPQSSARSVREAYEYQIAYRRKLLTDGLDAWLDCAYYQLSSPSLLPFCNETGDFMYQDYRRIDFPEWQTFAESPEYPVQPDRRPDCLDDYLESRAAYIFWRVFEALTAERYFDRLRLASPMLLGFAFHDGPQQVLYVLNQS